MRQCSGMPSGQKGDAGSGTQRDFERCPSTRARGVLDAGGGGREGERCPRFSDNGWRYRSGKRASPEEIREMIKDADFSQRHYRLISPGSTNTILRPLEPDIIGEMFVLEHLNPENSRREQIITMAWVLNSEKMTFFLERATNDFPKHPTLESLLGIL